MNISQLSDDSLKELCRTSRQVLSSLSASLEVRPDMQKRHSAIRDDMLETFSELAVKEPDLMRIVL
jgi:hypothetical protein